MTATAAGRRAYLPLDETALALLDSAKALSAGGFPAYAVTPGLRRSAPEAEVEVLEHFALQDAATTAAARGLPVVAAVDLEPHQVGEGVHGDVDTEISVLGDIPLRRVASLHVLEPAAGGRQPAERDGDADLELSWYDVTELGEVLRLLRSA